MRQMVKAMLILAIVVYPFVLHALIHDEKASPLNLLLAMVPLMLLVSWFAWRMAGGIWRIPVIVVVAGLGYFVASGQHEHMGLVTTSGLLHAIPNLLLMMFFGRTLRQGHTPLITQISRRINGELTPEIAAYTRRVTLAWTLYFAGQLLVSLLLYLFAPLEVWSLFINVLGWPLLITMFGLEYLWRTTRYPGHSKTSIRKAFEVYSRDFASDRKR